MGVKVSPWVPWWTTAGCVALAGVLAAAVLVCEADRRRPQMSGVEVDAHLEKAAARERAAMNVFPEGPAEAEPADVARSA